MKLFLTKQKQDAGGEKGNEGESIKYVGREKGENYIVVAQIHSAVWSEEEEEEAEQQETKR